MELGDSIRPSQRPLLLVASSGVYGAAGVAVYKSSGRKAENL
jgi:hypothetical protein